MQAARTDLVIVSDIVVDRVTDLGVFSRIRGKIAFIPFSLIYGPRPAIEPGAVVTLSVPRWYAGRLAE